MAAFRPSCIQLGAASEVSEGLGEEDPQGHWDHPHFTEVEVEAQREEPVSGSVRTWLGGILAPKSSTLCTCPLLQQWPPREGLLQPFWKILLSDDIRAKPHDVGGSEHFDTHSAVLRTRCRHSQEGVSWE